MSFAFFAALGGLVVTLLTVAVLNCREVSRQTIRAKAPKRRTFGQE